MTYNDFELLKFNVFLNNKVGIECGVALCLYKKDCLIVILTNKSWYNLTECFVSACTQ